MRVLILANLDLGLYKFRKEIIESLVEENEVFFCVPDGEFTEKIKELGAKHIPVTVLDRRSTNPVKDLKLVSFYRKTIKEIRPNIVLTYTIKPNVYGGLVCQLAKVPFLANVTGLGTTIENGGILAFISKNLYRIGLKNASCVFFQNQDNLNLFSSEGIVRGKTRLIPGSGVNLSRFSYKPYPDDENGIRFLFVGRIMKDKGIGELIEAIQKLHQENSRATLDIVGFCDEDFSKELANAQENGSIVYYGPQSDVRPFYNSCHCTVLPSYHEGLANVLLESSATGRPVITTRVPGCRETFEEDVTGFGCEARDAAGLYEAMKKFVDLQQEKREMMGIAARRKMEQSFDRNLVINAYKEEINAAAESCRDR